MGNGIEGRVCAAKSGRRRVIIGLISPSQSANGETIEAADVNNPVNTIANEINGNLDNTNIASGAAIATSKIAQDAGLQPGHLSSELLAYEEIGRATLGSAGDTITVSPISARKYLLILFNIINSGQINATMTFNNDSGNNYARRTSDNGGADATATTTSGIILSPASNTAVLAGNCQVMNVATAEKVVVGSSVNSGAAGVGTAPSRKEHVGKWVNTSDQITRIDVVNSGTGNYAIGSEVLVLGHD